MTGPFRISPLISALIFCLFVSGWVLVRACTEGKRVGHPSFAARSAAQRTYCAVSAELSSLAPAVGLPSRERAPVEIDRIIRIVRKEGVKEAYYRIKAYSEGSIDMSHECAVVLKLQDGRYYHFMECGCNHPYASFASPVKMVPDGVEYARLRIEL